MHQYRQHTGTYHLYVKMSFLGLAEAVNDLSFLSVAE